MHTEYICMVTWYIHAYTNMICVHIHQHDIYTFIHIYELAHIHIYGLPPTMWSMIFSKLRCNKTSTTVLVSESSWEQLTSMYSKRQSSNQKHTPPRRATSTCTSRSCWWRTSCCTRWRRVLRTHASGLSTLIVDGHIIWKNNVFESCKVGLRAYPFQKRIPFFFCPFSRRIAAFIVV